MYACVYCCCDAHAQTCSFQSHSYAMAAEGDVASVAFVEDMICIMNGSDHEPCAVKVHKVQGKDMLRVSRQCKEWCRLLASKPLYTRPFARLGIWKAWDDAIENADTPDQGPDQGQNEYDDLEGGPDQEAPQISNWRKRKRRKQTPIVTISLPKTPGSAEKNEIVVQNTLRSYTFEFKMQNVQWLRNYVMKEIESSLEQ